MAEECRTPSPNTCQAKPRRITLGNDGELERLDLSVILHIRPSDRPLFNRQDIRSCQQILFVYPVRTIVGSDTESEGRSRPGTPPPDEGVSLTTVRPDDHTASVTVMELTASPDAGSIASTGRAWSPGGQVMELDIADPAEGSVQAKRKKNWSANRLTKSSPPRGSRPMSTTLRRSGWG